MSSRVRMLCRHGHLCLVACIVFWAATCIAAQPTTAANANAESETDAESSSADEESAGGDQLDELLNMAEKDVEQLTSVKVSAPDLQVEVSTVSRQTSTVGRSPAAVFVITNEMIRRSGATSIPEVLRMAPGVQVARIDANKWAITARGFNGRFANKLLVQIDGRSVYTPLFAGVFWDVQDVLLEDVERIEVIRGPGATVWGANAVNGVINIITKPAKETLGTYAQGGAGTEERGFGMGRAGGRSGDLYYRVYGKQFERDTGFAPTGTAHDDWRKGQGGFRMDWEASPDDVVTLQGDYYDGYAGQNSVLPTMTPPFATTIPDDSHIAGGNVQWRWTRTLDVDSDFSAQFYYDRTERHLLRSPFIYDRDTIDFDFQHRLRMAPRHAVIWGFGYRFTEDFIQDHPFFIEFDPNKRALDLFSYFIQDEIELRDDLLYLTLGSKFQHNDFTGFEIQPTAKLLMTPSERQSLWASVSRAVRTPSRAEDDILITSAPVLIPFPAYPTILGNRDLESEELIAYEAGIRVQPAEDFSWDLALFYNDYDNLAAFVPGAPIFGPVVTLPVSLGNELQGETYGFELVANYHVTPDWRLLGWYSFLRMALHGPSTLVSAEDAEGESPRNQFYLQSSWNLRKDLQLDLMGRYTDSLPALGVPSYFVMDARVAWQATRNIEMAVVGRHLLDSHHPEFGNDTITGNFATEVEQEVYGTIIWRR